MSKNNDKQDVTTRRAFLKTLAATGGAVLLTNMPGKWEKPMVQIGTLPAFAQTSFVVISNLTASDRQGPCDPGGGQTGDLYTVSMDYDGVPNSVVAEQTRLRATFEFSPSNTVETNEVTLAAINITGDGANGRIVVPVCIGFSGDDSVKITVSLGSPAGAQSNQQSVTIAAPDTGGEPANGQSPTVKLLT